MSRDTHPRPRRPLAAPSLRFNISEQVERLRQEPEWQTANHNAITLQKQPNLSLILMLLGRGAMLAEHPAPGQIAIQVLTGRVRFRVGDEEMTLGAGEMVTMEQATRHELFAVEESTLLLTIGGKAKAGRSHKT